MKQQPKIQCFSNIWTDATLWGKKKQEKTVIHTDKKKKNIIILETWSSKWRLGVKSLGTY